MGEVVPFRARLAVDIPEQSQDLPVCRNCKPNGDGGYICVGSKCVKSVSPSRDPAA